MGATISWMRVEPPIKRDSCRFALLCLPKAGLEFLADIGDPTNQRRRPRSRQWDVNALISEPAAPQLFRPRGIFPQKLVPTGL